MKTIHFTLTIILLMLLASCTNNRKDYDATGSFEATEILVSSEANGKIMELNINEGDQLKAGETVGYVDSIQIYLKKMQCSSQLRSVDIRKPDIQKQIAALEQQIATARSEQQRMKNLVQAHAGNQKQVDDITNNIKLLERQLDAQRSILAKSTDGIDADTKGITYQIMQLDDMLHKCRIVNPQSGTVLVKYAEPGEITATGKPLYKIADLENINLRAYITQSKLCKIKLGEEVTVHADSGDENKKAYKGRIVWISEKAEFTPKGVQTDDERANQVYAVKIAVHNDGSLKIGQYGELVLSHK